MTNDETQKLLQLREMLIEYYASLEAPHSHSAVTRQMDVGAVISSTIKSIEDLVKDKVTFA